MSVHITYVASDGAAQLVDAKCGSTLMHSAVAAGVRGILGDCGGALGCATCHIYIEGDGANRVTPQADDEREMLEYAADVRSTSRLACQIRITDALDGLVVHTPTAQIKF